MTRTSVKTVLKTGLWLGALASLAACATAPEPAARPLATTPTQAWAERVKVTPTPDEILLAPHPTGLSDNQRAALDALVGRWLRAEGRELTVTAPSNAGAMAAQVRERLIFLGAPAAQVRVVGADPAAEPVLRVGFVRYQAETPKCGQVWENLTATRDNQAYDNFGCAIAANMAAQVANPEDLARPRDMTPADAGRRDTVANKYRRGEITSSARDEQASGSISRAIP